MPLDLALRLDLSKFSVPLLHMHDALRRELLRLGDRRALRAFNGTCSLRVRQSDDPLIAAGFDEILTVLCHMNSLSLIAYMFAGKLAG